MVNYLSYPEFSLRGNGQTPFFPLSAGAPVLGACWLVDGSYRPKHFVVCVEIVGVSHAAIRGKNGGISDANRMNLAKRTLFASGSDWILWALPQNDDQNSIESDQFWQISAKGGC